MSSVLTAVTLLAAACSVLCAAFSAWAVSQDGIVAVRRSQRSVEARVDEILEEFDRERARRATDLADAQRARDDAMSIRKQAAAKLAYAERLRSAEEGDDGEPVQQVTESALQFQRRMRAQRAQRSG